MALLTFKKKRLGIMNDSQKFLDKVEGKNIDFLIGSGASSDYISTLSIGEKENKHSIEDLLTAYNSQKMAQAFLKFLFFDSSVKNGLVSTTHIPEEAMDTLNSYKELIENMLTLSRHNGFERPKRTNIFTTNYDTFFEAAFDDISLEHPLAFFNDGSRGFFTREVSYENYYFNVTHSGSIDTFRREIPSINLYKLHGSLSWSKIILKDNQSIITSSLKNELLTKIKEESDTILKMLNQGNRIEITDENVIDQYLSTIESNEELKDELKTFEKDYSKLLIVSPTKRKFQETVFQKQYYQLLREFENELQKDNTVLICFGFSFKDEHILDLLKRSISNPSLQIFIIPYSKSDIEYINSVLKGYTDVTFLKSPDTNEPGNFNVLNKFLEGVYGQ